MTITTQGYLQDPKVVKMLETYAKALMDKRRQRYQTMRWEAFALGMRHRCEVDPPYDLKDERGRLFVFQDRTELLDHLRLYHNMTPPNAMNFKEVTRILDRGRTDYEVSEASCP